MEAWVGLGGRNGGSLCSCADPCQDGRQVGQHLVVAETNQPIAVLMQHLGTCHVTLCLEFVNISVYLDDQAYGWTVEIEDECPNRVLTSEPKTGKATFPKGLPEHVLCLRQTLAQAPCRHLDLRQRAANAFGRPPSRHPS